MLSNDSDSSNKDFFFEKNLEEISKDEILDEAYKRAENKTQEKKRKQRVKNKPFYKSGFLLILLSVFCLGIVIISPWAYIRCNTDNNDGHVDKLIFKNYGRDDIGFDNNSELIANIFESNNCSNSSCNYLGLDFNYFKDTPKISFYGFILLALMGLIFLIVQIIDRYRTFSIEIFTIIHSVFAAFTMIIGVYLLLLMLNLIGVYFLIFYNSSFLAVNDLIFISPVAIFLIIALFNIITWGFRIITINYREFEKKLNPVESERPYFTYKKGVQYNER